MLLLCATNSFAGFLTEQQKINVQDDADFLKFWDVFRGAVLKNDREKVMSLTQFPFTGDPSEDEINFKSKKEFLENYDKIFTDIMKKGIEQNNFYTFCEHQSVGLKTMTNGEKCYGYEAGVFRPEGDDTNYGDLLFDRVNGKFRLIRIIYEERD